MSSTSVTIHCADHEPDEFEFHMQDFKTFCVLNLDIRPDCDMHRYDFMFPPSMLDRLTRAVDAFNAAMRTESEPGVIEPAANAAESPP